MSKQVTFKGHSLTKSRHVSVCEEALNSPENSVIQRNYVLNDTAALKKKIKHETSHKDPFNHGTEAKDGSNVVLLFKTSFFEHMKDNFIQDLMNMEGITSIHNADGAKVNSESSGDPLLNFH